MSDATTVASDDEILAELSKACDDHARPADDADVVGGVAARFVAAPGSTAQTADVLRVAADHGLRVVVRGHGTKLHWGAAPKAVDLLVDTIRLAGVVEHAAGDLVVTARAGTSLVDLQAVVGRAGQELAFDDQLDSTVGGAIAIAPSGPRRLLRGTLRDLLIGVTFVRADGVVAKAGGKVVKNVAGYDFGKLLTGSYGTLGVVTEAVFRLHPRPPRSHHVRRTVDVGDVGSAVHAVLASQTVPSAVELDRTADGTELDVLLEGTDEGVAERATAIARLLDAPAGDGEAPPWWGRYPFGPGDVALKVTSAIGRVAATVAFAHDAAVDRGLTPSVRASAAGVTHVGLAGDAPADRLAAYVDELREAAAGDGGSVVVLAAPDELRGEIDVWGPVPGLSLMRRLKAELDPDRRLAPGRFVGGI